MWNSNLPRKASLSHRANSLFGLLAERIQVGGSYKKDGTRIPTQLSTENGLLCSLQKHWKDNSKVLIISADSDDIEVNDSIMNIFAAAFPMSGLSISQMHICDSRNEKLVDKISGYDVLILAGGHVPTQNKFFKRIRLMIVYAQPELEGESIDKETEVIS